MSMSIHRIVQNSKPKQPQCYIRLSSHRSKLPPAAAPRRKLNIEKMGTKVNGPEDLRVVFFIVHTVMFSSFFSPSPPRYYKRGVIESLAGRWDVPSKFSTCRSIPNCLGLVPARGSFIHGYEAACASTT